MFDMFNKNELYNHIGQNAIHTWQMLWSHGVVYVD